MGVSITNETHAALYCNSTDTAFGPVDEPDILEEFLEGLNEAGQDPRAYLPNDLETLYAHWKEQHWSGRDAT